MNKKTFVWMFKKISIGHIIPCSRIDFTKETVGHFLLSKPVVWIDYKILEFVENRVELKRDASIIGKSKKQQHPVYLPPCLDGTYLPIPR